MPQALVGYLNQAEADGGGHACQFDSIEPLSGQKRYQMFNFLAGPLHS
jgi:hypothetical protein